MTDDERKIWVSEYGSDLEQWLSVCWPLAHAKRDTKMLIYIVITPKLQLLDELQEEMRRFLTTFIEDNGVGF